MQRIITLVKKHHLLDLSQPELAQLKSARNSCLENGDARIYGNSLYRQQDLLYFIGRLDLRKSLFLVATEMINSDFPGQDKKIEEIYIRAVAMNYENSLILKKLFPFTAPVSLRDRRTTVGCGDRLGLATAGHIRAAREYNLYPVLAQQSIRELNFTGRTYKDVTADTAFLVFQEGFEKGYGADGDHLKTIADIDTALEAGMPMITLDLSEVMQAQAADWSETRIETEFTSLPQPEQQRLLESYSTRSFFFSDEAISLTPLDVKRCAVMYTSALNFAAQIDKHLRRHRGDQYDLEISIDETTTPTLPAHHLFIIRELNHRQVTVNSLAPRFTGEFQKAIDYIGDKQEFTDQFAVHCRIAAANGNYKISVHSGSDKFSVYPVVGEHTGLRLHLKTAGTSWLEAVRCIARCHPRLYRKMHKKAFACYGHASKYYHITADLSKIPELDLVTDEDLPGYLERDESRQLLHITYGGLLNDAELREEFFTTLNRYEEVHYDLLRKLFVKHIELLGVERI